MKKCFIIMPFANDLDKVYKSAIIPSLKKNECQVVRADEQSEPVILEGILKGIKQSDLCIADLTGLNKNVLYEIGVSHSANKPTILITQDNPENLPFDLKYYRVIHYEINNLEVLESKLHENIKEILDLRELPIQLIQEMLIPANLEDNNDKNPFFIASCPLSWRAARQQGGGFKKLRNTYGDHIGIRGIIQAFGLIKRLDTLPELINTGDFIKEVVLEKANIYCIASPKANHWTNVLLEEFCKDKKPKFSFRPDINSADLKDVQINVHIGKDRYLPPDWEESEHHYKRDFGLVIRGPHPIYPNCMVLILAGRGSIGTEAACRAVTEPKHIKRIKDRLQLDNTEINDYRQSFWAVVSLTASNVLNREIDIDSFEVIDAKAFK